MPSATRETTFKVDNLERVVTKESMEKPGESVLPSTGEPLKFVSLSLTALLPTILSSVTELPWQVMLREGEEGL